MIYSNWTVLAGNLCRRVSTHWPTENMLLIYWSIHMLMGATAPSSNHLGWESCIWWMNFQRNIFWFWSTYAWQMVEVCVITFTFLAHYTCPIGYPLSDYPMHDFLRANGALILREEANKQIWCFLIALFGKATDLLQTSMGSNKTKQISNFCEFMSRDQSMKSPGSNRLSFYNAVVSLGAEVHCRLFCFHPFQPIIV